MKTILKVDSVHGLDIAFNTGGQRYESYCLALVSDEEPAVIEFAFKPCRDIDQEKLAFYASAKLSGDEALKIAQILIEFAAFATYQEAFICGFETAKEVQP